MPDIYKIYKEKRGRAKNRPDTWLAWLNRIIYQEEPVEQYDYITIFIEIFESGWYEFFIPIYQFNDTFEEGWIEENPVEESFSDDFESLWFIYNSFDIVQFFEQFETNWFYINIYNISIGNEDFEDSSWDEL